MDGLTDEERGVLKSVALTLANPDWAGVAYIDVLSNLGVLMQEPMATFISEKPRLAGTYERAIKKRLEEIGRGCGVSLSGSVGASSKGFVVGATPSPDEVGLALIYGLREKGPIVFNPEINSNVPDARLPNGYLEIKDVTSVRKIYKRLADARRKMTSVRAKRRSVVLGVSDMDVSRKEIVEKVLPFLDDGTFDDVLVVWNHCGSERSLLKATAKKEGNHHLGDCPKGDCLPALAQGLDDETGRYDQPRLLTQAEAPSDGANVPRDGNSGCPTTPVPNPGATQPLISSLPRIGAWRNRQTRVPQEHVGPAPVRVRPLRPDHAVEPGARGRPWIIPVCAGSRTWRG